MKVETLIRFQDLEVNKIREVGELFVVSMERYHKLSDLGLVKAEVKKVEKKLDKLVY